MRIVLTVERYAPAIGGAERVVQRVAEGMAARGHAVHVMTGGRPEDIELGGVQVHRLPVSGNHAHGIRGDPSTVKALISQIQPELIFNYAAQTWATDCCFELLADRERPRMVMAPCGFSGLNRARYGRYFATLPAILRSYDALIFPSTAYQDWKIAHAAGVEQIFIVANGADPVNTTGEVLRGRIPTGQIVVTVGSHVLSKGHAAFAGLSRRLGRRRPLTGVIVAPPRRGAEALRGCNLVCQVRSRLSSSLTVIDGSREGAVADALAAADLFMFTSRIESGPLVILEAMAAGTPWVSLDVGHASQLAGGIVVRDLSEMLAVAGQILDGEHPQLGSQGQKSWDANHRWEGIIERYESVFEEILRMPRNTTRLAPAK